MTYVVWQASIHSKEDEVPRLNQEAENRLRNLLCLCIIATAWEAVPAGRNLFISARSERYQTVAKTLLETLFEVLGPELGIGKVEALSSIKLKSDWIPVVVEYMSTLPTN